MSDGTDKTAKEREQIVVPTYVTSNVLQEAHRQVGHLGVVKTFEMILYGFLPGSFKAVEEFCKTPFTRTGFAQSRHRVRSA